MTVSEVKAMFKGEFYDVEVYRNFNSSNCGFHTDRIKYVEDYTESDEVLEYQLMDEEDYNSSVCANSSTSFSDTFETGDKILVIKIA